MAVFAFFVVALCLVGVVESGVSPCSRGETYWCSQLQTAVRCGAVQHCMKTAWKKTNQPPETPFKNPMTCKVCKEAVGWLDSFLQNNKDSITQYLSMACDMLPSSIMAMECKAMVHSFAGVILKMIVSLLDPSRICSMVRFCTSEDDLLGRPVDNAEKLCKDCTCFFTDLQDHVSSPSTRQRMERYVEQGVCSTMRTDTRPCCGSMVGTFVPEFLQVVAANLEPRQQCASIGFCQSKKIPEDTPTNCNVSTMSKLLSDLFDDNTFKANATAKSVQASDGDALLWTSSAALGSDAVMSADFEASSLCDTCTLVVKTLSNALKSRSVQQLVVKTMQQLCKVLPKGMSAQCVGLVTKYGPAAVQVLANANPETVCKVVRLCDGQMKETN